MKYYVAVEGGRMTLVEARTGASAVRKARAEARGLYGSGTPDPRVTEVRPATADDIGWHKMMTGEYDVKRSPYP